MQTILVKLMHRKIVLVKVESSVIEVSDPDTVTLLV